jgi:hypothetical protein
VRVSVNPYESSQHDSRRMPVKQSNFRSQGL